MLVEPLVPAFSKGTTGGADCWINGWVAEGVKRLSTLVNPLQGYSTLFRAIHRLRPDPKSLLLQWCDAVGH